MRGDRLRDLRLKGGHTQESFAELLGVGNRQIWRYENGETEPDGATITKIAKALSVSSDYLLGLTDYPGVHIDGELTPTERAVIAAMRHGDKYGAIKVIVDDE